MIRKSEAPLTLGQRVRHKQTGETGVIECQQKTIPLWCVRWDDGGRSAVSQRRLEAAPNSNFKVFDNIPGTDTDNGFDAVEAVYAGELDPRLVRNELLDDIVWKPAPLTFYCAGGSQHNLRTAVDLRRANHILWLNPNRDLVGSDFADYGDRILLAELGYFSCDLPEAKAKRDQQAQIEAYIDEAYDVMGLDRKQQHALIAAKMEATRFDGIWARSTGEYSAACRRLDEAMLAANPAIAKSVDELRGNELKPFAQPQSGHSP